MTSDQVIKLHTNAQQFINQGKFKAAHQACIQLLHLHPQHADAHFLLAMIALNLQQMTKAIELTRVAIQYNPKNPEYYAYYARSLSLVNRYAEAREAIDKALALGTETPLVNDTLGVVLSRLGEHKLAVSLFNKAIEKQPNNPHFIFNLASSLKFIGDFALAQQAYEKVISIKPDYYQAHSALAELSAATPTHNNLQRLQSLLDQSSGNVDGELHLCHAMAKELECIGEYRAALKILKRGNGNKKIQLGYNIAEDETLFQSMKDLFNADFNSNNTQGYRSKKPIFVLGMPRSGTTLIDRILSSHSEVTSAGELQNFAVELKKMSGTRSNKVLDEETIAAFRRVDFNQLGRNYIESTKPVSDKSQYFIDKMPLNFLYVGLIKKALPDAKIIILNRHPMDVCLSNFRTLFAVNFSYYNYAYDLQDAGKYFKLFKEQIKFWQSIYAGELLEVSYEDLVKEPEKQIKSLLQYCGLEWQPECLNFHKNPEPVSTASSVQVRKPINDSSIGRWKRYGKELDVLQNYLKSHQLF